MVSIYNILLLGSICIFSAVDARMESNTSCEPGNRFCPKPKMKRLPFLRVNNNYREAPKFTNSWLNDSKSQAAAASAARPRDKRFFLYYPAEVIYTNNLYLQNRNRNRNKQMPAKKMRKPSREKGYERKKIPPMRLTTPPNSLLEELGNFWAQKKSPPQIYYKKVKEIKSEEESEEYEPKLSYVRDHAPPELLWGEESSSKDEAERSASKEEKEPENPFELSPNGDRVEFQMQGHGGPRTYIFGFDTGDGNNRQYRLEERLKDGTVKGQYGYYDARGKLRTIKYIARPMEGYQEKHHESGRNS